jgi:PAS domain S-box-containing protein
MADNLMLESDLQQQLDDYRTMFDALPIMIWHKDTKNRIVRVNRAAADFEGKAPESLEGKSCEELYPPERAAALYVDDLKVIQSGQPSLNSIEQHAMSSDGAIQWLQMSKVPQRDYDGNITGVIAFALDITERLKAEAAHKQDQERYRLTLEASPDPIIIYDLQGYTQYINPAFVQTFGWTEQELIGKRVNFVPEQHIAVTRSGIEQLLRDGKVAPTDTQRLTKDGRMLDVQASAALYRDQHGNPIGSIVIMRDIGERKQAEAELARSRELLQLVMDTIPQAIFWKDRRLRFLGCNQQFAKDLHLPSTEWLIGKDDYDLASAANAEQYQAADRHVMDSDKAILNFEEPQPRADGTTAWLRTSKAPLHDVAGEVVGVLVMYEDISERKQAEQERERMINELQVANAKALEASRLKSEFLATMSHELRTPLNAVIGFSGIMMEGMAGEIDEAALGMIQGIYDSSHNLLRLINDVLDLSKIEAGRMELVVVPLSITELAEQWQAQMQVIAEQKKLPFDIRVDSDVPARLYGDKDRIRQIVVNLLSNAFKFTEQGQVKLEVEWENESLVMRVRDTGIGIPPHALTYIFDEFRQVDSSSQRQFGGTGLGLAIVRRLCLMMGGNIQVSSKLGEGTVFTVNLPLPTAA